MLDLMVGQLEGPLTSNAQQSAMGVLIVFRRSSAIRGGCLKSVETAFLVVCSVAAVARCFLTTSRLSKKVLTFQVVRLGRRSECV